MPVKSAKRGSWKDTHSRFKIKKNIRLALIALALLISLLVFGQITNFTGSFLKPWQLQSNRNYRWDGQFNINLVIKNGSTSILIFNPTQKEVTIIKIPDNTLIAIPSGQGSWQLRSIYDLGELEKKGNKLLEDSLTTFLGIPIEGIISLEGNLGKNAEDYTNSIRQNPLNILTSLSSIKTDLTPWELIQINLNLHTVRFDKIKILDLISLNVLEKQKLADGTEIFTLDPIILDSLLIQAVDNKLRQEYIPVAVFNATDHPQLAQKAARTITLLGGNVIQVNNSPKRLENSFVTGEESDTLKRLMQIFDLGCSDNPKCDKIKLEDLEQIPSRAQINLFLGEDFFQRFGT